MYDTGTTHLYSWSGTCWIAILFEKESCTKSPLLRSEVLCISHGINMYGHLCFLIPLCAPYINCTTPIKVWAVRESLWEHFDAYRIFVHPPVCEISDMEVDLVGPKLAIHS